VITAEFEEKAYESPLYNQLERGNNLPFTPGQVLEKTLGFDARLFVTQGRSGRRLATRLLCKARLLPIRLAPCAEAQATRREGSEIQADLFLQAKRPNFYMRRCRSKSSRRSALRSGRFA
jgi:hypothetical protein